MRKGLLWGTIIVGLLMVVAFEGGLLVGAATYQKPVPIVKLQALTRAGDHNNLFVTFEDTTEVGIILNADFVEVVGKRDGNLVSYTEYIRSFKGMDPIGERGKLILPQKGDLIVRIQLLKVE